MRLFWLGLKVRWFELCDAAAVLWQFRASRLFLKSWFQLKILYLLDSPYQVSKRFLQKQGVKDLYQYGETPISLFADIMSEAGLNSSDYVYELGAGTGLCSLWLATVAEVKATAVEQVPLFCRRLNRIKGRQSVENLEVINSDYLRQDVQDASLLYLYASNLDRSVIRQLVLHLQCLVPGTRVISISYPLTDYCDDPLFHIQKRTTGHFPWGEADIYFQVRTFCKPTLSE